MLWKTIATLKNLLKKICGKDKKLKIKNTGFPRTRSMFPIEFLRNHFIS